MSRTKRKGAGQADKDMVVCGAKSASDNDEIRPRGWEELKVVEL